jgi:hypothetical protein
VTGKHTKASAAIVGVSGVTFSFSLASLDGSGVYHTGRLIESDNVSGAGTSAHVQTPSDSALAALPACCAFGVDGWKVAAGNSGLYRTTFRRFRQPRWWNFPFVTNGSVLFAIPDAGDPLL